ncbi:hypothetical protein Gotri_026687 [Gossypium trilobum]|uniref:DUF7745 domain-containing protein n=1 Tax=Gossypium trilobum TaxID=34281 RepID=A0A7J9FKL6_9ROSI|nr:hypothetical protein [Gossypium trilobum]
MYLPELNSLFYCEYDDLSYLLDVKVDKHLFQALAQYWNLTYSCFTFKKVDLVPTVKEYTTLLCFPRIQADKAYSRVANDLILTHPDTKKRVNVFALSIYGLVIFPKVLGHIDDVVSDLFDRLDKRVTPVPAILAETFKSLSACWRTEKVSYRVFSENYSPSKEFVATAKRDNIFEEKWMAIIQSLQDKDVEWRALWMNPDEILYRSGDFDWVPLLEIWGAVGYAPLILEIVKQDFKKKSLELRKMIKKFEEEKIQLGLDVDVQKLETMKMRKGNNKVEEDLNSLKTYYEKLRLSMRTVGLGKTSEQWRLEIQEENIRVDQARVAELERSLYQYRSHNSTIKLKASLSKIEELKGKIEELEAALGRDHIMGEALIQVREVANHL